MRSLEVPVSNSDSGLDRQVEAPDHLPAGEAVGHHCMLIRQLRIEALLVRRELPGADAVVHPCPVKGLQRANVGDGHLEGMARRLRRWRTARLTREGAGRADARVVEPAAISRDLVVVR